MNTHVMDENNSGNLFMTSLVCDASADSSISKWVEATDQAAQSFHDRYGFEERESEIGSACSSMSNIVTPRFSTCRGNLERLYGVEDGRTKHNSCFDNSGIKVSGDNMTFTLCSTAK